MASTIAFLLVVARMERASHPVNVLFLDLGIFKVVNDSQGHDAGDDVLVEVGRRIKSAVRRSDTVARFGGDEFVIVCEGSDATEVQAIIDRLKAAFVAPFRSRGTTVSLSVDIGIASATSAEDDPGQLLQAADRAVYVVKQREVADGGASRTPRRASDDSPALTVEVIWRDLCPKS